MSLLLPFYSQRMSLITNRFCWLLGLSLCESEPRKIRVLAHVESPPRIVPLFLFKPIILHTQGVNKSDEGMN